MAYLTSSVLLFTIAVLLVSFAVPYVKGFVFWDRLLGLGCQFYPPPRRRRTGGHPKGRRCELGADGRPPNRRLHAAQPSRRLGARRARARLPCYALVNW